MANILIFEDDSILAESWQKALGDQGHQAEYTANINAAMSKIYEGYLDIALIDIFIQENNQESPRGGIMLISKINMLSLESKPWLIAISGRSHDPGFSVLEIAKTVGADEYLKKPIDLPELMAVVDRVTKAKSKEH